MAETPHGLSNPLSRSHRTSSDILADSESEAFLKEPSTLPDFDDDEAIPTYVRDHILDPRSKDYPISLVARTVDLKNDSSEPVLTFRFWTLSTFWVLVGCSISSVYYFSPYSVRLTAYVVQLCSWGMGSAMARYLPTRHFQTLGLVWTMNPGPWNAKEHALIVVAYWGSSYTAYGLGPLSAMELYYDKKMNPAWSIMFLMTTQLMGYGLVGLYRDILVRPPKMFYPGVLPNVAVFNALHQKPSAAAKSLTFFCVVTGAAFCYQWLPSFLWPMLASLPLLCYIDPGNWKAFVLGSGTYGFGLLDFSLDWNYISFFSPLYTPLWATTNRFLGAILNVWILYPVMYFFDIFGAEKFAPMSSGTWDADGAKYNLSAVLTPSFQLNQTAMDFYSTPHWSFSYAMHFFWGFASTTGVLTYAVLFHGRSSWLIVRSLWRKPRSEASEHGDPYLKLTSHLPRAPLWWYISLLSVCMVLSIAQLHGGDMQLPWWGLLLITAISALFIFPSGILFAFSNIQIGLDYIAELVAGTLFPGKPIAVLTATVYGRQILEQCLNMTSDFKFCFYMKISERDAFIAQIYGTVMGPFVNWACMRLIIDTKRSKLLGDVRSSNWNALKTNNFFSLSVMWGVLGPRHLFSPDSTYRWVVYGFLVGPLAVILIWIIHRARPQWKIDRIVNPVAIFNGAQLFPIYLTTSLTTSMIFAVTFMGYIHQYHPAWFRKYNFLLGAGLDCGTQMMQVFMVFVVQLYGVSMPNWWGNDAVATDRCFPPPDLPSNVLN